MSTTQFFETLDHISVRVCTCTASGLLFGASLATYRGLPLPRTTIRIGISFALISTACFVPERIIYHSSFNVVPKGIISNVQVENKDENGVDEVINEQDEIERYRIYASHGLGGAMGGGITGGLFRGRPTVVPGILLMTPIMLTIAYGQLKLDRYKQRRLDELRGLPEKE